MTCPFPGTLRWRWRSLSRGRLKQEGWAGPRVGGGRAGQAPRAEPRQAVVVPGGVPVTVGDPAWALPTQPR